MTNAKGEVRILEMLEVLDRKSLIDEMLRTAKTIAVVGMSDKPWRASHNIAAYLARNGYRVAPVNPALATVKVGDAEVPCFPSIEAAQLAVAAEGAKLDLVDVFRASDAVPEIVDEVIRLGIPYLWLQDEVQHEEAVARAEAAGVKCIQNDCIFREHAARA
jgi:predicted CoA-binding protein